MTRLVFVLFMMLMTVSACAAREPVISNFEECVAAGYPMMKSNPPRCSTSDGQVFVKKTDTAEKLCVDKCGDGICQEIVCLGTGCPCPESAETCPQDCQ